MDTNTPIRDIPDYGIRLDKNGRFWHKGAPVTNPKVHELFSRSLKRLDNGTYTLCIGPDSCIIEIEDTPYVVRRLNVTKAGGDGPLTVMIELSDGTKEELDPATLSISRDNVLYCEVKGGEHSARFDRPPYMALAEYVVQTGRGFALQIGDKLFKIRERD
ncbi:MAG: DUF1285 domain-containing protein [Deltaproteobacteria bacterium]|nr:DUF1285 domain-containing protein [Deltaproteobacteria bacterium]